MAPIVVEAGGWDQPRHKQHTAALPDCSSLTGLLMAEPGEQPASTSARHESGTYGSGAAHSNTSMTRHPFVTGLPAPV